MKLILCVTFALVVSIKAATEPRFAPYVDVLGNGSLAEISKATGVKTFTLAFALASATGGCDPWWGAEKPLNDAHIIGQIQELKKLGGDVIVATGGAAGPYLETACTSAQALANAYKKILDTVGTTHLDIDIEAPVPLDNMNQALAQVQKERPQTTVSFTLEVQGDDYGITIALGVDVLKNAVKHGVRVDIVNAMTMEFPSSKSSYGDACISAAEATVKQMKEVWPSKSDAQLKSMIGVTPMIGRNFNGKIFQVADAVKLVNWAKQNNIGHLAFWSVGRDNGHCANGAVSPKCSSINQGDYEFTKTFNGFH